LFAAKSQLDMKEKTHTSDKANKASKHNSQNTKSDGYGEYVLASNRFSFSTFSPPFAHNVSYDAPRNIGTETVRSRYHRL
jgi:hypothetical protein